MSRLTAAAAYAVAPYVMTLGLVPTVAPLYRQGSAHKPEQAVVRSSVPFQEFDVPLEQLDLLPTILLPASVTDSNDLGYDEFVTDEHFTQEVTYMKAALVVDEAPPVHFLDQRDLETMARFED